MLLIVALLASGLVSHDVSLAWVTDCIHGLQYCPLGHPVDALDFQLQCLYGLLCLTFQFRILFQGHVMCLSHSFLRLFAHHML